jgi:hypothetical protein
LVGHARGGGEVVHGVVEQEAKRAGGNARAEEIVEGVGVGDGVALGIDHGEVSGLGRFVSLVRGGGHGRRRQEAGGARERCRGTGLERVDGFAPGGSVGG